MISRQSVDSCNRRSTYWWRNNDMCLICIEPPAPGETAAEPYGASYATQSLARRELSFKQSEEIEIDSASAGSENRRKMMIRDTEHYLNDPSSTPWPRASRAPSIGAARVWQVLIARSIAS